MSDLQEMLHRATKQLAEVYAEKCALNQEVIDRIMEKNALRKELVDRIMEIEDLNAEVLELRNALHQEIYS